MNHREERRRHLKRILLGSAAGLMVALLCPKLPPELQAPCRVAVTLIYSWVNTP